MIPARRRRIAGSTSPTSPPETIAEPKVICGPVSTVGDVAGSPRIAAESGASPLSLAGALTTPVGCFGAAGGGRIVAGLGSSPSALPTEDSGAAPEAENTAPGAALSPPAVVADPPLPSQEQRLATTR